MMEEEKPELYPGYKPKPASGMRIVGINLIVLVAYTLICFAIKELMIFDIVLIALHVILCVGSAIIFRKWSWLLSGVLVLVIGFSTCVSFGSLGNMH